MSENLDFLRLEIFMREPFVELKNETGANFFANGMTSSQPYFMLHTHSVIEILYFYSGIHRVVCDNIDYVAHPGDMLLIRSYTSHEIFKESDSDTLHYVLQISPAFLLTMADSEASTSYLIALSFSNNNSKCLWTKEDCEKLGLDKIFANLIKEKGNVGYCYDLVRHALSAQIISIILRDSVSGDVTVNESEELKRRIYDSMLYIQRHYNEDISAEECAKNVSLSLYYFSRSFKTIAGRSFKKYLNFVRITHAKQLLASTDKPITEIATECGFNSVSHFIVTYKELENTTPLAYRKRSLIK